MPKKFDTNPLDPEFPEKAKVTAPTVMPDYTAPTPEYTGPQQSPFSTAEFPTAPGSITEEETRRFQEADFQAYSYQPGPSPVPYQPQPFTNIPPATAGRSGIASSVPEKWLIGLPYIPFSVALIARVILLLVLPKYESKVRFHAAQGLAAHVGILIVTLLLGGLANVTDLASLASRIFTVVTTIMLIIFAIKAWQGKGILIESVEDLTNWLEEKIGPIKH
ncbi:MAG: hypothetical protein QUS14_08885 [Pyrinomonadaceae bacterium]|nr:hypothetical protein [Pyrinomonadaceae bacterium]